MRSNVENYRKGLLIERVKYVLRADDARVLATVNSFIADLEGQAAR